MLYSLLYGNKPKPRTSNSKALKVAIQTEQVKNVVPLKSVSIHQPLIRCPLELSHGDDLMLCEATKMVEDMIGNITLHSTGIRTYPRKKKKITEKYGSDSKILQNILQLSNIYSQKSDSSFEEELHIGLCINCPEVDPDAHKLDITFEFEADEEDIFTFYDPLEFKTEAQPEKENAVPSAVSQSIVPNVNLQEYTQLDENMPNWYEIYHRIDHELLRERLNNDDFLNPDSGTKKFYIKIGSTLRLVCISITDVPDKDRLQIQNEEIVKSKLFDEIDLPVTSSKRRHDCDDGEQSTPKKHLLDYQPIMRDISSANKNIPHLLDEDDTFINAIKLELSGPPSPNDEDLINKIEDNINLIKEEYHNELPPVNFEQLPSPTSISSKNHKFVPCVNQCFNGFQTGSGKPIDLPKDHDIKKYLQLYENLDVTDGDLLST